MRAPRCLPILVAALVLVSAAAAEAQSTYVSSTFTQGMTPLTSPTWVFPYTYTLTTFTQGMTPLTSGTVIYDSANGNYTGNMNFQWVWAPSNFDFKFYGSPVTAMCVTLMGYIVLTNGASLSTANTAIPSTAGVSMFVAPFWDDIALYNGGGGKLWYQLQGSAPNRIYVFEYLKVNFNGQGTTYYATAQVKLYEGTRASASRTATARPGSTPRATAPTSRRAPRRTTVSTTSWTTTARAR
jgi:hypothetical protein